MGDNGFAEMCKRQLIDANQARAQELLVSALADELTKAGEIITAMLNAMTDEAKHRVAVDLERRGVSPDGMTRANEREAVLRRARVQRIGRDIDEGLRHG